MMAGILDANGVIVWLSAGVPGRESLLGRPLANLASDLAQWPQWQQAFARVLLTGSIRLQTEVAGRLYVATLERLPSGFIAVEAKLSLPDSVTFRERDILTAIALGQKPKQFASRFGITENTADSYRRNLKEKLGVGSTAGLVRLALHAGLID